MEFHRTVRECAGELGLEIRDEWVRSPKKYDPHFAQFGHQQFHELWNLPQRPDGVFVFPDLMVSGVITAILERRLDVPHDLKVIFHANDLLPYVCPFPATFLLAEVGRYASALIDLIRCQLEGGEPRTISVPFSVVSDGNPFRRPS